MDLVIWLGLAVLVVLLGFSAFFSSSETSLFSLNAVHLKRMRADGNPNVELIQQLLSQPRRLIVTILIGNEFVNVVASAVSAAIVIHLAGPEYSWLNILIMVPMLLLFGEITPKTLAIRNNIAFAGFQSRYLELFARAITPVRYVIRGIADYFTTLIVGEERSRDNLITEEMVRTVTHAAVGEGALDRQEAKYIQHIFDFGDKTVRDVMTVRSQIQFLPTSMPLDEMVAEISRTRHSKVPVRDTETDTIVGVLFARDLLDADRVDAAKKQGSGLLRRALGVESGWLSRTRHRDALAALLREPYVVPETKPASELFLGFRSRKLSIALASDEFGSVTGLCTMEDLLECIFGDIPSDSDTVKDHEIDFEVVGPNRYRVPGSMTIETFHEHVHPHFTHDGADTIGGALLIAIGEVPADGSQITIGECTFTVASVVDQRIREVIVDVAPTSSPEVPEAGEPDSSGGTEKG